MRWKYSPSSPDPEPVSAKQKTDGQEHKRHVHSNGSNGSIFEPILDVPYKQQYYVFDN